MTKNRSILWALLISAILHGLVAMFFLIDFKETDQRWSGGSGPGNASVVYVDLGTLSGFSPEAQEESAEEAEPTASKGIIKQKKEPEKPKPKTKRTSSEGSGSVASDTPNTGSGPGLDAGGAVQANAPDVKALIRKRIFAKKFYPLLAKENGITGKVTVSFGIGKDGSVQALQVTKSSGHDVLDEAALKAVRKAAPLPYFAGTIGLTLEYELR